MNRSQFASCIRVVAGLLFVASFAVTATAQEGRDGRTGRTALTFSAPVRLPGVTLAAGTYVFQRVGSDRDMRSMQVFSVKPQQLLATLRTSPVTRARSGAEVVFHHTPAGVTPALAELYVDGGAAGSEFIYSREEQQQFAAGPAVAQVPAVTVIR